MSISFLMLELQECDIVTRDSSFGKEGQLNLSSFFEFKKPDNTTLDALMPELLFSALMTFKNSY